MKIKFFISLLTVAIIGTTAFFSNSAISHASETPENSAKQVVQQFFDAMTNENYTEASELAVDLRYSNKQKQIEKYEHYNSVSDFKNMTIIDTVVKDQSNVVVTFEGNVSGIDSKNDLIVKEINDEWKLILGDNDPATIAVLNAPEFGTRAMVDYYSFTNFQHGVANYTINSFSTLGNAVNLIGWQDAGTRFHANVDYQVAQDAFIGWKTFGSIENVSGRYTSAPGDRFSISLTGVPKGSDYHIRIVNWTPDPVNGAGNVYTN